MHISSKISFCCLFYLCLVAKLLLVLCMPLIFSENSFSKSYIDYRLSEEDYAYLPTKFRIDYNFTL